MRRISGLSEAEGVRHIHDKNKNGLTYANSIGKPDLIRILFTKGGYFKFVVCRNPYARLVSVYNDLISPKALSYPNRDLRAPTNMKLQYAFRRDLRPSAVADFTFKMFVEACGEESPIQMDRHWQPQTLVSCMSFMKYDVVLKMEDMAFGMQKVTNRIGAGLTMDLHLNQKSKEKPVRDLFDDESLEIVRRVYVNDFKRFRYEPDDIPDYL